MILNFYRIDPQDYSNMKSKPVTSREYNKIPLISEFSFDYDQPFVDATEERDIESFPLSTVTNADLFYRKLQKKSSWFPKRNVFSKTKYAYEMI